MAEEQIRYNVELDTAKLTEDLLRVRQEIDNSLSSSGGGGILSPSFAATNLSSLHSQESSRLNDMVDRFSRERVNFNNEIQSQFYDNFRFRGAAAFNGAEPVNFSERSFVENFVASRFGFGYDQRTSTMTRAEFQEEASRNLMPYIPIIGSEAYGTNQAANYFMQISKASVGGELSRSDANELARSVRNLDISKEFSGFGFDRAQISSIVNTMAEGGAFMKSENPEDYLEVITKTLESVRTISRQLKMTAEEAAAVTPTLMALGYNDMEYASVLLGNRSKFTGLSPKDMLAAAETGGSLARAMGLNPLYGSEGMQQARINVRNSMLSEGFNRNFITALGGEEGYIQSMVGASQNYFNGGMGILSLGGGTGPQSAGDYFNRLTAGNMISLIDPELGVIDQLGKVADLWYEMEGRAPTDMELAQFANRLNPSLGLNTSLGVIEQARNTDTGLGVRQRVRATSEVHKAAVEEQRSRISEENRFFNRVGRFFTGAKRSVGEIIDIDFGGESRGKRTGDVFDVQFYNDSGQIVSGDFSLIEAESYLAAVDAYKGTGMMNIPDNSPVYSKKAREMVRMIQGYEAGGWTGQPGVSLGPIAELNISHEERQAYLMLDKYLPKVGANGEEESFLVNRVARDLRAAGLSSDAAMEYANKSMPAFFESASYWAASDISKNSRLQIYQDEIQGIVAESIKDERRAEILDKISSSGGTVESIVQSFGIKLSAILAGSRQDALPVYFVDDPPKNSKAIDRGEYTFWGKQ